jgi:ParB family transcriptional regulator, chromosome partitioning protein
MSKSPSLSIRQDRLRNSAMAQNASAIDFFSTQDEPEGELKPLDLAPASRLVVLLPLDAIALPQQPIRNHLEGKSLDRLALSIGQHGLRQPLHVRRQGDSLLLVEGLRRLLACRQAGLDSVPVFIDRLSADQAYEVSLVENMLRENLSPLEEADGIIELMRRRGYNQQRTGEILGRSKAQISKFVRISRLTPTVRQALDAADLGLDQLYQIALQKNEKEQLALIRRILNEKLNTRSTRQIAAATPPTPRPHPFIQQLERLEKTLRDKEGVVAMPKAQRLALVKRLETLMDQLQA